MAGLGSEKLSEDIRSAVADGGMLEEILRRDHKHGQFYDLLHPVQVAEIRLDKREGIQGGHTRGLAALLD